MNWDTVIVAALSLLGTFIGSYSGLKLMSYRIEQLEHKVDKIDSAADRIPVIEEHLKHDDMRLDQLEQKVV
jgi:hypothetical protein